MTKAQIEALKETIGDFAYYVGRPFEIVVRTSNGNHNHLDNGARYDYLSKDTSGYDCHLNGKNYAVRRHGNLTTFDGLVEFRKLISARDGCSEIETDVIKYDYQILDDAYWLLSTNGYKIIRKLDTIE
jgi:hypothetical protein